MQTKQTGRANQRVPKSQAWRVFNAVVECYVELRRTEPLVCSQFDRETCVRKLTDKSIHFACDVERATESVLDTEELQAAWFRLAAGQPVDLKTAAEVVRRCARIYTDRGLAPWDYFTEFKYGRLVIRGKAT